MGPPLAQVLRQLESVVDVSGEPTPTAYHAPHFQPLEATASAFTKSITLKLMQALFVQTIAFELIDLVPDNADDASKQKDSLDATLAQAINSWAGGITITV